MTQARRYAFDTVFSPAGEIIANSSERDHRLSNAELEAIRQEAFAKGRAAAAAETEQRLAAAMQRIAAEISRVGELLAAQEVAYRQRSARMSLQIGRRLAGAAIDRFAQDRLLAIATEAMESIADAPRVTIGVAPGMAQSAKPLLDAAARDANFYGLLIVREQPERRGGDIAIEWGDGAMTWDSAALDTAIESAIAAAFDLPTSERSADHGQ
jgi:flagellar assembly protein FliH